MNYKTKARHLKKAGIINYDLRRKLTPHQKANITRQSKKYNEVLGSTQFVTRHLKPKTIKILKERGFATHGNKVWIPTDGFQTVHVKGDKIIRTKEDGKAKFIDSEFIISGANILTKLKELFDTKLPRGHQVSARIGGHGAFKNPLSSYEQLFYYITEIFKPKDSGSDKEELIEAMSIVNWIRK